MQPQKRRVERSKRERPRVPRPRKKENQEKNPAPDLNTRGLSCKRKCRRSQSQNYHNYYPHSLLLWQSFPTFPHVSFLPAFLRPMIFFSLPYMLLLLLQTFCKCLPTFAHWLLPFYLLSSIFLSMSLLGSEPLLLLLHLCSSLIL